MCIRDSVCVTLGDTGVTLTIDNKLLADGNCPALSPLTLPSAPRGGTGLVPSVGSFKFQPLGDTDKTANITANIAGTTITVDFKTGYVF